MKHCYLRLGLGLRHCALLNLTFSLMSSINFCWFLVFFGENIFVIEKINFYVNRKFFFNETKLR